MKRLLTTLLCSLMTAGAWAAPSTKGRTPIDRDTTYEQNLRWENSADKNITPAKVLRFITRFRGGRVSAPSPTEFQPIVNIYNSNVRLVAAIAYKF